MIIIIGLEFEQLILDFVCGKYLQQIEIQEQVSDNTFTFKNTRFYNKHLAIHYKYVTNTKFVFLVKTRNPTVLWISYCCDYVMKIAYNNLKELFEAALNVLTCPNIFVFFRQKSYIFAFSP